MEDEPLTDAEHDGTGVRGVLFGEGWVQKGQEGLGDDK